VGSARRRECIALAAALAATAAAAALPPARAQAVHRTTDYLARMDSDGDGRVSLAEYQAWMGYGFDAMDRDHDGVLSPVELPGGRGAALTREAHRARLAAAFARQDRDRDGYLDARELAAPP
jgi:Ca2+-binding EF-hand superfamily protein